MKIKEMVKAHAIRKYSFQGAYSLGWHANLFNLYFKHIQLYVRRYSEKMLINEVQ